MLRSIKPELLLLSAFYLSSIVPASAQETIDPQTNARFQQDAGLCMRAVDQTVAEQEEEVTDEMISLMLRSCLKEKGYRFLPKKEAAQ